MKRNLQDGDMEVVGYIVGKDYRCALCAAFLAPNKGGPSQQPIFAKVAREYNITCDVCGDPLEASLVELSR